jgi:hypothetical protein
VAVPLGLLAYWFWSPKIITHYELGVTKGGNGDGTVASLPLGIDCGHKCLGSFARETEVRLTAAPDSNSQFSGWSGDTDCADGLVVMTANKSCRATFIKIAPHRTDDEIKRDIAQRLTDLRCVKLSAEVRAGVVDLSGRIASDEQRARVRTLVQGLPGVVSMNEAFRVIPWPFCEVLEILEPVKDQAERQGFGLVASFKKLQKNGASAVVQGVEPIYYRDEKLVIEVKTPNAFPSYIYVDYYTANGGLSHLFPNQFQPKNGFPPNTVLNLGQAGAPVQWEILPPFGLELVTVIASKTPLPRTPTPDKETTEAYLKGLRQALTGDGAQADVAATFQFIRTQD